MIEKEYYQVGDKFEYRNPDRTELYGMIYEIGEFKLSLHPKRSYGLVRTTADGEQRIFGRNYPLSSERLNRISRTQVLEMIDSKDEIYFFDVEDDLPI